MLSTWVQTAKGPSAGSALAEARQQQGEPSWEPRPPPPPGPQQGPQQRARAVPRASVCLAWLQPQGSRSWGEQWPRAQLCLPAPAWDSQTPLGTEGSVPSPLHCTHTHWGTQKLRSDKAAREIWMLKSNEWKLGAFIPGRLWNFLIKEISALSKVRNDITPYLTTDLVIKCSVFPGAVCITPLLQESRWRPAF